MECDRFEVLDKKHATPAQSKFHYIVERAADQGLLFREAGHIAVFEHALARVIGRYRARVHAFCWGMTTIDFIVEIPGERVNSFILELKRTYTREVPGKGRFPRSSWGSNLQIREIDSRRNVLELVRHVHHVPVTLGIASEPAGYRMSSHAAYLGTSTIPWLTTDFVLGSISANRRASLEAYRDLMRVRYSFTYPYKLKRCETFEELLSSVLRFVGIDQSELFSRTRSRAASMARALVTWHARDLRLATVAQVGRVFGRTPAALALGIRTYRSSEPALFEPDVFYCWGW